MKRILDACCSIKSCWFDKQNPEVLYMDIRSGEVSVGNGRIAHVNPDVIADFTKMPFPDESFALVLFDPPHFHLKQNRGIALNKWGTLGDPMNKSSGQWKTTIRKGFEECMRVLKPDGVLVFKWSEIEISLAEVLKVLPRKPLFGHTSGHKQFTKWLTFIK